MATIDVNGNKVEPQPFDPNRLNPVDKAAARLPSMPLEVRNAVVSMNHYLQVMHDGLDGAAKAISAKAIAPIPQAQSFVRMNFIPDSANAGLMPWPNVLSPDALRKVSRENVAARIIINARLRDMDRYSSPAPQPWRPGWNIEMKNALGQPSASTKKDIQQATNFLLNCNMDGEGSFDARVRDTIGLKPFNSFLASITSDRFTYDGVAIWTDMTLDGRIKAFTALPAGYIRLADPKYGYKGNPDVFAALVNETENPVTGFTRDELIWAVGNPRNDPDIGGYGWPEIEQGLMLAQGFMDAITLNTSTFNKNSIPNGMLLLMGDYFNQDQIDLMMREWTNMKRGISKTWGLPVMSVPADGDVKLLDFNDIKGQDVRYKDHMNMMIGALCAVYGFPVRRLGFFTSGNHRDNAPLPDESVEIAGVDDPAWPGYLGWLEGLVTQYLLAPNWPELRFVFRNKDPKNDAREYEAKKNARTWKESRAEADLPPLTNGLSGESLKIAEIMENCPEDPAKMGAFQVIVSSMLKAETAEAGKDPANPEGQITSKQDPARSREHGHAAGVRRNSARESASAAKN